MAGALQICSFYPSFVSEIKNPPAGKVNLCCQVYAGRLDLRILAARSCLGINTMKKSFPAVECRKK